MKKEFQVAEVCSKPALCLLVLLNENQFIKFLCFYIFLNVFSKTPDCLLKCGNVLKKSLYLLAWAKANSSFRPRAKSMNFVLANNSEHAKKQNQK